VRDIAAEIDMRLTNAIVFGVATCVVSAGSSVVGRQRTGELSGFREFQVEGHDIVAAIEIVGTKHVDSSKLRQRFRSNGAELRLGLPLDSQTLCRFKEVLRDVMREKGFSDADITHDTRPTYGNRQHLTLTFTIIEGQRSRPVSRTAASSTPAQRCLR
jgi:outer membrane protein assembly factor BamA